MKKQKRELKRNDVLRGGGVVNDQGGLRTEEEGGEMKGAYNEYEL